MYSIGDLRHPKPTDPQFNDADTAIRAAVAASVDDWVWAVWDNDTGEILAIVYQGIAYT